MTKFPFDIVGFDLDGTLIDTAEDLRLSCNHALELADIAPLRQRKSALPLVAVREGDDRARDNA